MIKVTANLMAILLIRPNNDIDLEYLNAKLFIPCDKGSPVFYNGWPLHGTSWEKMLLFML